MYKSLMTGLLSIKADLPQSVELAARHGFGGVDTDSGSLLAPNLDVRAIQNRMRETGVRPGYVALSPGRVPAAEADLGAALAQLPAVAKRAQSLGFRRAALVLLPFHETLDFDAAFAEHVRHFNEITAILDDFDIALAIEYVSPLTRRAAYPHPFIYDMAGLLRLLDALDSRQAGILLDTFHWHCAGESAATIIALPASRVVVVHINDAPDLPNDEQTVGVRTLPGATGVIDHAGFSGALRAIGYAGPVTCEPMAGAIAALNAQSEGDILTTVSASMDAVMQDSDNASNANYPKGKDP